ncbi:MAG: hypothetical protein WCQ64_13570, partial [Acidobacteriota bacterium]
MSLRRRSRRFQTAQTIEAFHDQLLDAGIVVVACGGGGIAVVEDAAGMIHGVPAVIDKDLASCLLARELGAETLVISTAVEKVCLDFG